MRNGFAVVDPNTGAVEMLAPVDAADPTTRMNDGKCDPEGRFWAGHMPDRAVGNPGRGSLYRLDARGRIARVLSGLSLPNGLDWSPDGATMYFIDTLAFRVEAFDMNPSQGHLSNRRPLVEWPARREPLVAPDGMCVDAEGFLWIAFWGGWCVRRYAPDGKEVGEIRLPVAQVTSCAFGGEGLEHLYITTAAHNLSDRQRRAQPLAGALFYCRPGVSGRPAYAYSG